MTDYFFDDRINQLTFGHWLEAVFLTLKNSVKQQIKDVINY